MFIFFTLIEISNTVGLFVQSDWSNRIKLYLNIRLSDKVRNMINESRVMFIEIPVPKSGNMSPSPLSSSPCREKHGGVFDLISRRFGRGSHDELCFNNHSEEDSRSSSTDSCSSTSGGLTVISKNNIHTSNLELNCSTSDSSSNDSNDAITEPRHSKHRRSSSSIRRALQNLSLPSRSLSCSSTPSSGQKVKKNKNPTTTKCTSILRQPATYTYVKGLSGLPQRVPMSAVYCHYTHR